MGKRQRRGEGVSEPQRTTRRRAQWATLLVWHAVFALAYYLAVRLGLEFRFQNTQIGVVWLANALLLAALLLTPARRWPGILAVTALAHAVAMGNSIPAWRVLWQIVANTAFTTSMVAVLRRVAGSPLHFGSRRQ